MKNIFNTSVFNTSVFSKNKIAQDEVIYPLPKLKQNQEQKLGIEDIDQSSQKDIFISEAELNERVRDDEQPDDGNEIDSSHLNQISLDHTSVDSVDYDRDEKVTNNSNLGKGFILPWERNKESKPSNHVCYELLDADALDKLVIGVLANKQVFAILTKLVVDKLQNTTYGQAIIIELQNEYKKASTKLLTQCIANELNQQITQFLKNIYIVNNGVNSKDFL